MRNEINYLNVGRHTAFLKHYWQKAKMAEEIFQFSYWHKMFYTYVMQIKFIGLPQI